MLVTVRILMDQFGYHRLHVLRDQADAVTSQCFQRLATLGLLNCLVLLVGGARSGGHAAFDVLGEVRKPAVTPLVAHALKLPDQVQGVADRPQVGLEADVGRPADRVVGRPPYTE